MSDSWKRSSIGEAELTNDKPLSDAEKLRVLAAWFDIWDRTPYEQRNAELDIFRNGGDEVQRDLRRIADSVEREIDIEILAEAIRNTYIAPSASRDLDAQNVAAEYERIVRTRR